eukprot:1159005-Pelagomonas_calceolata.AAC.6
MHALALEIGVRIVPTSMNWHACNDSANCMPWRFLLSALAFEGPGVCRARQVPAHATQEAQGTQARQTASCINHVLSTGGGEGQGPGGVWRARQVPAHGPQEAQGLQDRH